MYSRIRHARQLFTKISFSYGTVVPWRSCASTHPTLQNKKWPKRGHFLFWWEWVDSNHLRLKPTDLQSAPALQLRRTPRTFFAFVRLRVANKDGPSSLRYAAALNFQSSLSHRWKLVVRAAGLEPAYQAWKACVLALVLCPQRVHSMQII